MSLIRFSIDKCLCACLCGKQVLGGGEHKQAEAERLAQEEEDRKKHEEDTRRREEEARLAKAAEEERRLEEEATAESGRKAAHLSKVR